ncbi:MAG: hypothetical protein Q4D63_02000 [Neisseria animaloris]|nr:hypothetical protein [Neisseria animaloris]
MHHYRGFTHATPESPVNQASQTIRPSAEGIGISRAAYPPLTIGISRAPLSWFHTRHP